MKIFVFDTETTWFINKKEPDLTKQPHIIQFAWILGEVIEWEWWIVTFNEEERVNILINPWASIPYASSQIHHIYDIDVKDKQKYSDVSEEIIHYINTPDVIIGHNVEYDVNMVLLELRRLQEEYKYKPKQVLCTMNQAIDFCKLPKRDEKAEWYKRPKLGELHKVLFGEYFVGAHDALTDVEATLRCFIELMNKWVIVVEQKRENVMSLF